MTAREFGEISNGPQRSHHSGSGEPAAVDVVVRLRLSALGNRRETWHARARRTRKEILMVLDALRPFEVPALPAVVWLERIGWNRLDVDGLVASVKAVVDAVARFMGTDDRDPRLRWHLSQAVTREVRIVRGKREAAASLRIVVRAWEPADGTDLLRVLARS